MDMDMDINQRLQQLNITLPKLSPPVGAYVPAKRIGNLIYVSGQLPLKDGTMLAVGQVPSRCAPAQAKVGARQCVINALAAVQAIVGDLSEIDGVARVGAFISSDDSFTEQPAIANGASELLLEIFGDAGRHARAAVGVNTLPLDAAVEIEFIFVHK
jgi:enamine deaminase RidA (YjgF/YER057c/UK114 family)